MTLDIGDSYVDVEVYGQFKPGEVMVYRYPDGSGYPGSPDEFEVTGIRATDYYGSVHVERRESQEWFEILDRVCLNYILDNVEEIEQRCIEKVNDEC